MNQDTKHNIIVFTISIIIIIGIVVALNHFIMGRDGLIHKISTVESDFDQTEVSEKLTELVKEKYMAVYNESKANADIKLDEAYNADVAIAFLAEKGVLEYYYYSEFDEQNKKYFYAYDEQITEETKKREDLFYINTRNIEQVNTYGKGNKYNDNNQVNYNDVFLLQKNVENDKTSYVIKYYNQYGKEEIVGNLELANPIKK